MTTVTEWNIERWKEDQRLCDLANTILTLFVDKQINARDSLRALEKAKSTIEVSIYSATWGQTLTCETAPNEAGGDHEAIIAEIDRRKAQSNVQDHCEVP